MSTTRKGDEPGADAPYLITGRINHASGELVGKLRVKPQGQERIFLGSFTANDKLKGFSVGITPKPDPDDSVTTQIANTGTAKEYKLLLHVTNYGTKPIVASVWRL